MVGTARRERGSSQSLKALLGIRELVFSGEVGPGVRLSEVTLSGRLGISRTPIRAALAQLDQEGVVETIPSGGYTVRGFTPADVADAIELRGALEGMAARLAAERGVPPARLQAMHTLLAELDALVADPAQTDFQAYIARNGEFHEHLHALSGSETIRRELERAMRLPFAGPNAFISAQEEMPEVRASLVVAQAQHRAIVNAIELREGARAEALAREHARLARANLDAMIEDRKRMTTVPGLSLING
ncbi:GntR family transcriptional regulator [Thalassobaculum sp. OXR-137]|uniref:GntR family transcriptional regulator n=1 Tax=Thalassobaculum sp. OXR-137 TaxID=3100173 RepID=UPI002AC92832|nr:GntR family transcriptional regulator [Thalassobaculum sp. OXR-137]WPZ32584.1 GntR family transcriptional regulator [Thalassobaculum sp. OXR-137]